MTEQAGSRSRLTGQLGRKEGQSRKAGRQGRAGC
jgi:hypothetical protein